MAARYRRMAWSAAAVSGASKPRRTMCIVPSAALRTLTWWIYHFPVVNGTAKPSRGCGGQ